MLAQAFSFLVDGRRLHGDIAESYDSVLVVHLQTMLLAEV